MTAAEPHMPSPVYQHLPAIVFSALTVSLVVLGLLVLWPVNPLTLQRDPQGHEMSVLETEAGRGDTLHIRLTYCKGNYLAQTVRAWIEVDGKLDEISSDWLVLPPGCHNSVLASAPIPPTMSVESVGRLARLKATKYYRIRGQTYLYTLYSGYFLINH